MRLSLLVLIVLAPVAIAQNPAGMSEAEMQSFMQQMQQAQACMQNVDQNELQALQRQAQALSDEIDALCAQGKRNEAERTALAYGREMNAKPVVQQMKKCGELMPDMAATMPGMAPQLPYQAPEGSPEGGDICD